MASDVRVAVVGCGYWGKNLVRNFAEIGALEALVDAHQPTVEALIAKHGGRSLDFEAALADPGIDAVAIAAPAALHYRLAKQALEAGKHVFVEKPLALEVEEAKELCALAERLDRRLMVGHLLQYHPIFLELKRLVREGKLGRLQYVYSNRLNLGKIRREEDILWSFAPHDLSMILSLIGSEPEKVEAVGGYYLHDAIADVTTTHLAFPGGERAHVFVSWLHPFKEQKLVVVGSDAMAVFDDGEAWERKLLLYPHKVEWKDAMPVPVKADAVPVTVPQDEPLKQECLHFIDCVRTGATPRTDGREGLRVLSVLSRAAASLRRARGGDGAEPTAAKAAAPAAPRVAKDYPGVTIHETAYVDAGVEIGAGSKIWHFSHILGNVRLGKNVNVGQNVVIGPKVTVGDNVKIQNNVSVYEGVTLEDGVFCGPSCVFTNVNNPRSEIARKSEYRPTLVRRGASIGANATIVCGHTLGEYSFIAAGAVVAKDVPAFALMAGVPARRIGWMSHAGAKLGPDLVCPETGRRYRETGPHTLEEIA
ncbi:Gfo/Idh/MocA family oxidoreductase [Microvirga sp. 17 mud 1-3]|uniref:Gfo/Idh/MocA family oxidoreductase n=1 Tax=Microvirga sp. 17 mud 1-3 TaxID=2082949 RepID=UPI000D6BECFC|nr:Gfo/Idh/MocA family oxidoreductase [Microvirga sp. 17 mud 1-3]AWM87487.1 oxidoreductase [Microvirga sp. 17 mud 1-3]AWM87673.1 oxidoreductase [Microvirga sp. 17 mud 1-3]